MINGKQYFNKMLQVIVVVFIINSSASGDSPTRKYSYTKVTKNNKYILVMLRPWARQFVDPKTGKIYKHSGLYKNDGSSTPLWTINWFARTVIPDSDGKHLVRFGPWASSTYDLAVSFYKEGKQINSYRVRDLVKDESKLRRTVSHFFWKVTSEYKEKEKILNVKTVDGQEYNISIANGFIQSTEGK